MADTMPNRVGTSPWITQWMADERRRALDEVTQQRAAELARAAAEQLAALEGAVVAGVAEIRWVADERLRELDDIAAARTANLERSAAARERIMVDHVERLDRGADEAQATFDRIAADAVCALEAATRRLHRDLADDAGRVGDAQRLRITQCAETATSELASRAQCEHDEIERSALARSAELTAAADAHVAGLSDLAGANAAALHGVADEREAAIRAVTEERIAALESRRAEVEALADDRLAALGELAERLAELEAATTEHIAGLDARVQSTLEVAAAHLNQLEQTAAEHSRGLRQSTERAKADFDAAAETRLREGTDTALREVSTSVDRAEGRLGAVAAAHASTLDTALASSCVELERAEASRVKDSEAAAVELESLHAELSAALREDLEGRGAALDHAALAWLGRIDRAGRRRRAAVHRRQAAPPAAAAVLAAGVLTTVPLSGSSGERQVAARSAGESVQHVVPAFARQAPAAVGAQMAVGGAVQGAPGQSSEGAVAPQVRVVRAPVPPAVPPESAPPSDGLLDVAYEALTIIC